MLVSYIIWRKKSVILMSNIHNQLKVPHGPKRKPQLY